jgi:mannosyl-oligosaccharide alpha-1,2-mannosidase
MGLSARDGLNQDAEPVVFLAEIGSLSLEFTRLSQLSEDPKFFDAVQRIYDVFEAQQSLTEWPGLWPLALGARDTNFTEDNSFTFGAMADSMYEYLPKVRVGDFHFLIDLV